MSTISQVGELPTPTQRFPNWIVVFANRTIKATAWLLRKAKAQHARKNLRVCESVSLGEKRFVAVVQVDGERFLIGGSPSSVAMLTRLQQFKAFADTLDRCQEAGKAL